MGSELTPDLSGAPILLGRGWGGLPWGRPGPKAAGSAQDTMPRLAVWLWTVGPAPECPLWRAVLQPHGGGAPELSTTGPCPTRGTLLYGTQT